MKKIAFLIGNDEYSDPSNKLCNAVNDATKLSEKLSVLGFKCKTLSNVKSGEMYTAISALKSELNNYEVGLFFFAGHGVQVAGENFLAGIDTSFVDEGSCKYTSVALDYIIGTFENSSIMTKIFILDACRDNPFETKMRTAGISTQFAPVYAPKGSFIAFATSPGQKASDVGINGNGAFTSAILSHIETPGLRIEDMFKKVRNTLGTFTNNKQISWEHTSLMGDFYFNNRYLDGTFLTVYADEAFSDSDFILTKGNIIHNIISALKSHDWYTQNPAIDKIRTVDYSICNKDEIFVLGRNIYQAACGSANDAIRWIESMEDKLNNLNEEPAFHLLNGILFEIYFDSKGKLRNKFKTQYFNEVLAVANMPEYSKSCEFIKTHLQQYEQRIIYIPGTEDAIYLDVIVRKNEDNQFYISEIRFEGRNILYNENGSELYIYDENNIFTYLYALDKLEDMIRDAVAAPKKYIKINYNVGRDLGNIIMSYDFKLLRYSI